jgi:hypothetical protein
VHILPYVEQVSASQQWDVFAPFENHPAVARDQILSICICPTRRQAASARIPDSSVHLPSWVAPCGCVIQGGLLTTRSGSLSDYGGNLGDPSPQSIGQPTDFQHGGNGTGVLISSRPICRLGRPTDWIDKLSFANLTDGTSNTLLVGELHLGRNMLHQFPEVSPMFGGQYFTGVMRVTGVGIPLARSPDDPIAFRYSFGSWHPGICNFALCDGSVRPIANTTSSSVLGALAHRNDGSGLESGL